MSNTEIIALAAVVVTGLGLIINFLAQMAAAQAQARFQGQMQRQLEEMKEEFDLAREQRHYVLSDQHEDLKRISRWLMEGHRLASEICSLRVGQLMQSAQSTSAIEKWKDHYQRMSADVDKWLGEYSACHTLAIQYDSKPAPLAPQASGEVPPLLDLDQILAGLVILVDSVGVEVRNAREHLDKGESDLEYYVDQERLVESWWMRGNQLIDAKRNALFER